MPRFGRVLTAMASPFDANGGLDIDGAQKLARWLLDNGNDGLVVAGTTGESATLTHDEQISLIAAVKQAAGDASVIAGAGSNDTRAAIELTERATDAGADGILSVTPYYNRPSQAGLKAHFSAVAAATTLPVVLYDIVGRTGRAIEAATMLSLFEVDNIVGVKDASGNPARTAEIIAAAPAGTEVYSGDDKLTLPLLAVGAVGVIGVCTHWAGREMSAMIDAFTSGNVDEARRLNQLMLSSYAFEGTDDDPNPVPTKVMLELLGLPSGGCRAPMGPPTKQCSDQAAVVLADLGREA